MDKAHQDFSATPVNHFKPVGLSDAPAKSAGKKFLSDRPQRKATSMNMQPVTPKSKPEAIPARGTKSHKNLMAKAEIAGPAYGPKGIMVGAPKSGDLTMSDDASGSLPKKWHKKGYSKDTPSALPAGSRLARKWGK